MISFEGNQNQTLWLGQEGPVRLRRRQFRSFRVGDGGGPSQLVLLVLVAAAVSETPVATFLFLIVGDLSTLSQQVFITSTVATGFFLPLDEASFPFLSILFPVSSL